MKTLTSRSMVWHQIDPGGWWDSPNGSYRIVPYRHMFLLIILMLEDDNGDFKTEWFDTMEAAMQHAEKLQDEYETDFDE